VSIDDIMEERRRTFKKHIVLALANLGIGILGLCIIFSIVIALVG